MPNQSIQILSQVPKKYEIGLLSFFLFLINVKIVDVVVF